MKSRSHNFSFIITTIIFLTGYGFFVFAAPPGPGGYNPGETLNPDCTPGQLTPEPCIVKSPLMTADNGLTATVNNVQLGGTLLHDTNVDLNDYVFSVSQIIGPQSNIGIAAGYFPLYSAGYTALNANNNTESAAASVSNNSGSLNANISYSDSSTLRSLSFGVDRNVIAMTSVAENSPSNNIGTIIYIENSQGTIKMSGAANDSSWNTLWQNTDPTDLTGLTHDVLAILTNDGEWTWGKYLSSRDNTGTDTPVNFLYTNGTGRVLSAPISFLTGGGGGSYTADNGLTLSGSNVQLGGTLVQNTSVTQAGYNLEFSGGTFSQDRTLSGGISTIANNDNLFGTTLNGNANSYKIGDTAAFGFTGDGTSMGFDPVFQATGVMDTTTGATAAWVAGNNGAIGGGFIPAGEIYLHFTAQSSNNPSDPDINGFVSTTQGFVISSINRLSSSPVFHVMDGLSTDLLTVNQAGDITFGQYPDTRDDSATLPSNFLYTNTTGQVLSAPLSAILPTGVNGLQNIGQNTGLGGTLSQNTLITQSTYDFTVLQGVASTGNLVFKQGLTTVTGLPGNVMGYIASNGDASRSIVWASGASNKNIHTLSGSGDPNLLHGGTEVRTDYDITDTTSGMITLYAFDTPHSDASYFKVTPKAFNFLFDAQGDLQLNNSAGTAGYVIASNGAGTPPTWQDPNLLISDERLKSNVADLPNDTLSKLSQVRTVTYTLNTDQTNRTQVGFLAQDLEQYFPELVGQKDAIYKGVYYAQMTPVLVEAIRELNLQMTGIDDMAKANPIRDSFTAWLADQANGIVNLYAEIVHTKKVETEQLCIKDVCMDRDQLYTIMQSSSTPPTVMTPGPDAPSGSDNQIPATEPATQPASDPVPTPDSVPDASPAPTPDVGN